MVKRLLQLFRKWRFPYTPLVEITISRERLLHNLHTFQNINPNVAIAPVLKSNAYGHGLVLVTKIVDKENIPFIIVDSYHEAMILRNVGIKSEILIIGYTATGNILKNKLKNIAFTIVGIEQLEEIAKQLSRRAVFHIKIDTGMHRQGILPDDTARAMELVRSNKSFILEGIFSHLADADGETREFTDKQIKIWNDEIEKWKKEFPDIKYFHLSATGGTLYSKEVQANVARLGIGLYGIDPNSENRNLNLEPALEMKSVISGTKIIERGEKVGYNGTFTAPSKMKIATVPAGYYEGIDRRLSNKGFVKIGNDFCPIIGRVSMNITTVDISSVPNAKINTPVVLISSEPSDKNSLVRNAQIAGDIAYGLMVHIPYQLRRKLV